MLTVTRGETLTLGAGVTLAGFLQPGRVLALLSGDTSALVAFDARWREVWRRPFTPSVRYAPPVLHLRPGAGLWVLEGRSLVFVDVEGQRVRDVEVPCDRDDVVGALLPVADGFLVGLSRTCRAPSSAAVIRIGTDGQLHWRREVRAGGGFGEPPSAEKGRRPERPGSWIPARPEPLIVSAGLVLASFADLPSTGIGVAYALDLVTGHLRWQTRPQPTGHRAAAPDGGFLIGAQGYGSFETTLHSADGSAVRTWPSHGRTSVLPDGRVLVVEVENVLPSRCHLAELVPDGTVEKGAPLPGYHTSKLALLRNGARVFWRAGALFEALPSGALRVLAEVGGGRDGWAELAWDGEEQLAVAVNERMPGDPTHAVQSTLAEFRLATAWSSE